ncbi:MAG: D-amino acid dehydrogenase [Bradyrhizobiaceae bacterium]|nr:MAG: D-amino acid dehydrogenase [Bradyrhizobiaceae bacterium]
MSKIAIIGAGITGVTTAFALSEKGHEVTVFDRHRYAAMETSYANGGQLSASNAEVWNHWPTVIKALRWIFRADAPLLLNPKPSWHKYSWLAEFIGSIPKYRENTVATTRLAIAARSHLLAMAEKAGVDFNAEHRGILHFYETQGDFEKAKRSNGLLEEGGLERRQVSAAEICAIEPALQGNFVGGFFTPSDFTGDIHKFTRGVMRYLEGKGVAFVQEANVFEITRSGRGIGLGWSLEFAAEHPAIERAGFDAVVICAGTASRNFASMLGDRVNIYPVKGYSITVELQNERDQNTAPWVSLLDDRAKIVTSRLGAQRFRIAGTAELNGFNRDIRADRIKPLVDWARRHFPEMDTGRIVPWAGLRPMMPDMMPRVGPGNSRDVFYNTGHGHLGWTLSAATAELVSAQISQSLAA